MGELKAQYALKAICRRVPTMGVRENDVYWVCKTDFGPTGSNVLIDEMLSRDLLLFDSEAEAKSFGETWEGHPHWVRPKRCEVVIVEPVTEIVITGYKESMTTAP